MFLHTGVSRLSVLRPFRRTSVWLVGVDVRRPFSWRERFAVGKADPLLSISRFSSVEMQRHNPTLPLGTTVHLCTEPDDAWLAATEGVRPPVAYSAAARTPAVLIVSRQVSSQRYKGHEHLIAGWSRVLANVPNAELWVVGG